jgi:hypothetical protein
MVKECNNMFLKEIKDHETRKKTAELKYKLED